jgi:anti-anti-sigma factor
VTAYKYFNVQQAGDVTAIHLTSSDLFDSTVVSEMQDVVFELIELEKPAKLIIDFSEVRHCSSAVISHLLNIKQRILAAGGALKLCGQNAVVRDVFRVLSLDKGVFEIYQSQSAAMKAFNVGKITPD